MTLVAFDTCPDLIVRTDWGHTSNRDHGVISDCGCKAEQEQRPCARRGICIKAREEETWTPINSKTFTQPKG